MGAITDLLKSERGILALALIAAATVLCGLHQMTTDQWTTVVQWVFVTYAAAKTITGAAQIVTSSQKPNSDRLDALFQAVVSHLGSHLSPPPPPTVATAAAAAAQPPPPAAPAPPPASPPPPPVPVTIVPGAHP